MSEKTILQKLSENACRFIYKNYEADEIANGKDMVMYCIDDRIVLSIYTRDDSFDFLLIFGKKEREEFEARRGDFPQKLLEIYDSHKPWNDGKWLWIPVADMEMLEAVKQLILIKEKPNRKPFPKETAIYSKCGMRCDMCVYYLNGINSEESKAELQKYLENVFGEDDYTWSCPGCVNKDSSECEKLVCAKNKGFESCLQCEKYPCSDCGLLNLELQTGRSTTAETLKWAILPYVGGLD